MRVSMYAQVARVTLLSFMYNKASCIHVQHALQWCHADDRSVFGCDHGIQICECYAIDIHVAGNRDLDFCISECPRRQNSPFVIH